MSYEILVGLNVVDEKIYQQYRTAMKPVLHDYDGDFCYDLKISEVLKSESNENLNRVFTLNFPSVQQKDDFFSDPQYLQVKQKFFDRSVDSITIMASYQKL